MALKNVRWQETRALQIKIGSGSWQPKINRLLMVFLRDMKADGTNTEPQLNYSVQQRAGLSFRLKLKLTQFLAAHLRLPTYGEDKPDSWSEVSNPTCFASGGERNRRRKTKLISTVQRRRGDR